MPAFNEEAYIGRVVRQLVECRDQQCIDDVIVVDDGSTDATAAIARDCGAEVVELGRNSGKASAVAAGARLCRDRGTEVMVMLDADLQSIERSQLEALLHPLRSADDIDMTVGTVQGDLTGISGQRAIRLGALAPMFNGTRSWVRKLFLTGYGLEVALHYLLPRQQVVHTDFVVARPAEGKHLGVRQEVDATNLYIHQRTELAILLRRLRAKRTGLTWDERRSEAGHALRQARAVERRLYEMQVRKNAISRGSAG